MTATRKFLFGVPIAITALVLLLVLAIQTPLFKAWLKDRVVEAAGASLDGRVTVESLHGNLLEQVTLENILVEQRGDTTLSIEAVAVGYDLTGLLAGEIRIDRFLVRRPRLHLARYADTLNVAALVRTPEEEEAPFDWDVQVDRFEIDGGVVTATGLDPDGLDLPDRVDSLNAALAVEYGGGRLKLDLQALTFRTSDPDLRLGRAGASVALSGRTLTAREVALDTDATSLRVEADVDSLDAAPILDVTVAARPLDLGEVRAVLGDLSVRGAPDVTLTVRGGLSDLDVSLLLESPAGRIDLTGRFSLTETPWSYGLRVAVTDLDLGAATGDEEMRTNLNFDLEVDGRGTDLETLAASFSVRADTSVAAGHRMDALTLTGDVRGDSIRFDGRLALAGARATFEGYVDAATTDPDYGLSGSVDGLNLVRALADPDLPLTDLNVDFVAEGSSFDPGRLAASIDLDVRPSRVRHVTLDSARLGFRYADGRVVVEEARVSSPLGEIRADGFLEPEGPISLQFDARLPDLGTVAAAAEIAPLQGQGRVIGRVAGTVDSARVEMDIETSGVVYGEISVPRFEGTLTAQTADLAARLEGRADGINAFGRDSLATSFVLDYEDPGVDYEVRLRDRDQASVETVGTLTPHDDGVLLDLRMLGLTIFDQAWALDGAHATVAIRGEVVETEGLSLVSGRQRVELAGRLDPQTDSKLTLRTHDLDLGKLGRLIAPDAAVDSTYKGTLDVETNLTGELADPVLEGRFTITGARYGEVTIERSSVDFLYREERVDWSWVTSRTAGDSLLRASGFLPAVLSLSPFDARVLEDAPLEIRLVIAEVGLASVPYPFGDVKNLQGTLAADLQVYNRLNDLRGTGFFEIRNAGADLPALGTKYRNGNLRLKLADKEVVIERFELSSGGTLKFAEGSLSLSEQAVETYRARLRADRFRVVNNDLARLEASGTLELSGDVRSLTVAGDLTVDDAVIYYTKWMAEDTIVELSSRPYFVVAPDTVRFDPEGAIRFQKEGLRVEETFTETDFYRDMRIDLGLRFRRNSWVRGPEANVEIEGRVDLVKQGPEPALFGSLASVRGYYELQGNRFDIETGEVHFQGNPQINPTIRVEAAYVFRDDSGGEALDQTIRVIITGTVETPQIRFTIDGREADQKDVLSILLFGQPFDSLPIGQRKNVADQSSGIGDKATGFLTTQALRQLSTRLGKELNLDMLQIQSGDDLTETKLRVGKYITDAIYVSVSQDFGSDGEQQVKLEYELPKEIVLLNLFLQALKEKEGDSAVDVIWKYEW